MIDAMEPRRTAPRGGTRWPWRGARWGRQEAPFGRRYL